MSGELNVYGVPILPGLAKEPGVVPCRWLEGLPPIGGNSNECSLVGIERLMGSFRRVNTMRLHTGGLQGFDPENGDVTSKQAQIRPEVASLRRYGPDQVRRVYSQATTDVAATPSEHAVKSRRR